MAEQQPQQPQEVQGKIQIRNAVLIFCKNVSTPLVLYFDNAQKIYEDVKALINTDEVKMVEFEPIGPIRKAAILSSNIASVAIQEERYLVKE